MRLLDGQDNPHALAGARAAADVVPYPWRQLHCAEYRRNAKSDTCRSRTCTRCAAFSAGDPMPYDDY